MVSEISIFILAVENLQFNCDQCNRTNSSEKRLTEHMWKKQNPSEDFRHYQFDHCSQAYQINSWRIRKSVRKVTENATWKMNQRYMVFIIIRLIFGIEIANTIQAKTTLSTTWRFILRKIRITVVCLPKSPSPGATWRVMLEKIWILMHSVEGKSYQGTTERDTVKGILTRIYITVLRVEKDLYPGTAKRHIWRVLLDRIYISVWIKRY